MARTFLLYFAGMLFTSALTAYTYKHDPTTSHNVWGRDEFFLAGLFWPLCLPAMVVGLVIRLSIFLRDRKS